MAFGGNAPTELIKYWSQFLDDSRDLAEHYISEEHIRDELQQHYINQDSVRGLAETHIAAAVVLWHGARRVNEEILDSTAVQLATDNYAASSKTTTTSEIVA